MAAARDGNEVTVGSGVKVRVDDDFETSGVVRAVDGTGPDATVTIEEDNTDNEWTVPIAGVLEVG